MDTSSNFLSIALLSFFSLFSVINPIKFVVVFLSMSYFYSKEKKVQLANKAMIIAFLILIISMLIGEYIFAFLRIEMYSFKIAGGILLSISGINMLLGSDVELPSANQMQGVQDDLAIFPLAIPVITGPGAISTGIVLFSDSHNLYNKMIIFIAVVANFVIMYVLVQISYGLANKLNKFVLNILFKSCGLLLSALAVNIFISGLKDAALFG